MISFKKFTKELLQEALPLKYAKKKKLSRKYSGGYSKKLDEIFGNKDRLFIPIKIDYSKKPLPEIAKEIKTIIKDAGYTVASTKDYIDGLASKIGVYNDKNKTRIGKLLQKHEPDGEITVTTRVNGKKTTKEVIGKPFLHEFKKDPIRNKTGDGFYIVISRHPYDVAGSSTDRSWNSCMNLGTKGINYGDSSAGAFNRYVTGDIQEGTLVAYIVSNDEIYNSGDSMKTTLKKPLSRILIKPHQSRNGKTVYTVGGMYGNKYEEFFDKIKEWVEDINDTIEDSDSVTRNRRLYNDTDEPIGFDFDPGNEMADNIMEEVLGTNNSKRIGNEILIKSTPIGQPMQQVNYELTIKFNIKHPVPEFRGEEVSKSSLNSERISELEKNIYKVIFSSLPRRRSYTVQEEVTLTKKSENSLIAIINISGLMVYSPEYEEGKYVFDDDIEELLYEELSGYEMFDYDNLKIQISSLISKHDPEEESKNNKIAEEEKLKKFDEYITEFSEKFVYDTKFKIYKLDELLGYKEDELLKISKEFEKIDHFEIQARSSISKFAPNHVDPWEANEFTQKALSVITKISKKTFNVPTSTKGFESYKDDWNIIKLFDIRKNLPQESYDDMIDVLDSLHSMKHVYDNLFKTREAVEKEL